MEDVGKTRKTESIGSRRKRLITENGEKYRAVAKVFEDMRSESISKMHKRHQFLTDLVKDYNSLEDFARDKSEFFEIMGVRLEKNEKSISLYFQLDFNEYEEYFVVPTLDKRLAVSHIIWWQNEACANEMLNIFTQITVYEVEKIFTTYS